MGARDRRVTIAAILAAAAALIGWDVYAALSPGDGDTISEVSLAFARRHPSIAFLVGGLLGHLFWPLRDPPRRSRTIPAMVVIALGVVLWDALGTAGMPQLLRSPAAALVAGLPLGHFLWGQRAEGAP